MVKRRITIITETRVLGPRAKLLEFYVRSSHLPYTPNSNGEGHRKEIHYTAHMPLREAK
jgi:hypothetical protein